MCPNPFTEGSNFSHMFRTTAKYIQVLPLKGKSNATKTLHTQHPSHKKMAKHKSTNSRTKPYDSYIRKPTDRGRVGISSGNDVVKRCETELGR